MFRLRCTIEAQPRSKKGHPPHSTTGVAKRKLNPPQQPALEKACSGWPGTTSETMMASRGRVSTAPTHRRRVMLASSGLAALAVTVRGSSAMPQIGQAPGRSRTICGCMGQVYSMRSDGWCSGHTHLDSPVWESTSGCMGRCIAERGRSLIVERVGRRIGWISLELCPAALRTEVPGAACVLNRCRGLFRQHLHAAYRIHLRHHRICCIYHL